MLSGSRIRRFCAIIAVAGATAGGGCDKAQLLAPTTSTITLTAPARVLPVGGTTEVSAVVVESAGTPVQNGTTVRFSTTLGTVSPTEVQTRNGVATTTFSAGTTSGTARVTANSGAAGGGSGTSAANVVEIVIGAAAATSVLVTASPSTVLATGGVVAIVASALDASGNRLVGVTVSFSTTTGALSASTVTTDSDGEARVQLTTSLAATVTARAGNQSGTASVTVATPTSVTIATTPNPSLSGNAITLTVTPATGTTPRIGLSWGDGNSQDLGLVAAARGVTHAYTNPGIYSITVTATGPSGDTFSTSTTQTVTSRPAPTLTVTPTTGLFSTTIFAFTVTPAANSSPSNVAIDFGDGTTFDFGGITAATAVPKQYSAAGTYTVRATQTDSGGTSAPAVIVLRVTAAP
jgi:hypothetical protein